MTPDQLSTTASALLAASKKAVVTGADGQDGSFMCEALVRRGFEVTGTVRPGGATSEWREKGIALGVEYQLLDITDDASLRRLLLDRKPDWLFNFAAKSRGTEVHQHPSQHLRVNTLPVATLLEVARSECSGLRIVQASSSAVFDQSKTTPQNEKSPRKPSSPYGISKLAADQLIEVYRHRYGLHASSAILFSHESERRGKDYVTARIVAAAIAIHRGSSMKLRLRSLDARRDWGYAPRYVEAMMSMAEMEMPCDYVLATGSTHSVAEFCDAVFSRLGMSFLEHVEVVDESPIHDSCVNLRGDASLAHDKLGFEKGAGLDEIVDAMVQAELERHVGGTEK